MKNNFNYSDEKAEQIYYKVQSMDNEKEANQWISPWPGYVSQLANCNVKDNEVNCKNGLVVDLKDLSAKIKAQGGEAIPKSLVFIDDNKTLQEKKFSESKISVSAVLIPAQNGFKSILCDPLHAKGMFTRLFFMDGYGLRHFELFDTQMQPTGDMIYVWKINWEGGKPRIPAALAEKTIVSPGNIVQVNYIGWLENSTVFDSSITDWKNKNITKESDFDEFETKPLQFKSLGGQMIMGFDAAVVNMKINETKTVQIAPEDAYGTDPKAHPLGNKTLNFKVRVEKIN